MALFYESTRNPIHARDDECKGQKTLAKNKTKDYMYIILNRSEYILVYKNNKTNIKVPDTFICVSFSTVLSVYLHKMPRRNRIPIEHRE